MPKTRAKLGYRSAFGLLTWAALVARTTSAALVQNYELWSPMDFLDTRAWQASNWANWGMFLSAFAAKHVSFGDGVAALRLDDAPSAGRPFSSAELQTLNTFTYGNFETNMKAARASGTVTGFFTYTGTPAWDEIDVEILGKDTTKVQLNYFVNGVGGHEHMHNLGFDAADGFHKFRVQWGQGFINWYVDDAWIWGVNTTGFNAPYGTPVPVHPMKIMANVWAGTGVDSWLGPFRYAAASTAYVDYVKYTP